MSRTKKLIIVIGVLVSASIWTCVMAGLGSFLGHAGVPPYIAGPILVCTAFLPLAALFVLGD